LNRSLSDIEQKGDFIMDFQAAQNFWVEKDKKGKKMPDGELLDIIVAYIKRHNTMALATGYGDFVRNTPIEYEWYKDAFWFLSEGGMKYIALEKNRNVCIAIFDQMDPACHGLQVMGKVEFIGPDSKEYREFLEYRHIGSDAFSQMPYPMPMMRAVPITADYFDSTMRQKGFFVRQHYDFK